MSLASSKRRAMVSPAAILMLTSSLSSNLGSLGKCLQARHLMFYILIISWHFQCFWVWATLKVSALLAQDVFELAGVADGEQQSPGQQRVGVELAHLRADRRTVTVRLCVGPGEQVLEAFHGGLHILKQGVERRKTDLPIQCNTVRDWKRSKLTKMSSSATRVQRPRLVAT